MNIHAVYAPFFRYFRTKRMARFAEAFDPAPTTTILDVGGTPNNWELAGADYEITLLNVTKPPEDQPAWERYAVTVGDGTKLDFADAHFDIAYSNSVIEHVGSWEMQQRFAAELRRVGRGIWLQTPARSFPVEPHYLALFIHWMPKSWRRGLGRNFTAWGWVTRPTKQEVADRVDEIRLLGYREMVELFPDCEILRERFMGMTKSYIAVRECAIEREGSQSVRLDSAS